MKEPLQIFFDILNHPSYVAENRQVTQEPNNVWLHGNLQ
jgi:hypothetical protein